MNRDTSYAMSKLNRLKDLVFKLNVAGLVFVSVFAMVELVAWQSCRMLISAHAQMREPTYVEAYSHFDWAEEHVNNLRKSYLSLKYQPYYLWGLSEVRTSTYNVIPDWGGIRKTINVPKPSPARKVRILLFGGSTAFSSRSPDEYTIASLLSANLNRRFDDVEFSLTNLGRGGFVNDQEIVWLTQILTAGETPDVVIFYDGVNDIINKVCRGVPHYRYELFRSLDLDPAERAGLFEAVLQHEYVGQLARLIAGSPHEKEGYVTDRETLLTNARAMVARYEQNMAFMRKLGEAYGFQTVFIWQPNLFTTGKRLTDEESGILENDPNASLWRLGFDAADHVMKETKFEGKPFHDLSDVLDDIEKCVFFDPCHVSAIANEAIGDRIAEVLVEGDYVAGMQETTN